MARSLVMRLDPSLSMVPDVMIHTPTSEKFIELMKVYEVGGFRTFSNENPTKFFDRWNAAKEDTCVGAGEIRELGATHYSFGFCGMKELRRWNKSCLIWTPEQFYNNQKIALSTLKDINKYYEAKE